jgi:hypothetical protein
MVNKTKKKNKKQVGKQIQQQQQQPTRLGGALRTLGRLGGATLGSLIGMPGAGGDTGHDVGAAISRWLGSGDYTVTRNSIALGPNIPIMHRNGQSIVVRHKEYVGDVVAGVGTPTVFNVALSYPLNPGLPSSFPWLSTIAQQFQEYTWKGCIYHFVSTSGQSVASTNTGLGSVIIATNYRATAPAYINKQQMLNEYFSCDSKPAESFCHPIECDPRENPYNVQYVRTSSVPTGEDQKTYDLGVVSVATQGLPTTGIICGEIWVSYEIELRKPIISGSLQSDLSVYILSGTSPSTTNPLGTTRTEILDTTGITASGTTLTFPSQIYGAFFCAIAYQTTTSIANITGTFTNCSVFTTPALAFQYTTLTAVAATVAFCTFGFYIPYNTSASTVAIAVATMVGSNAVSVVITQLPLNNLALF